MGNIEERIAGSLERLADGLCGGTEESLKAIQELVASRDRQAAESRDQAKASEVAHQQINEYIQKLESRMRKLESRIADLEARVDPWK